MIRVALKGVLGRKLRAILTGFAIVLGVAMISGSFVLTDTLTQSFNGVYKESYQATDAVISSTQAIETENGDTETPPFSGDVLQKVEALSGVRAALGTIEDQARLIGKDNKPIGAADSGAAIAYAGSPDDSQNPLKLVQGAWPAAGDEIAIDRVTAAKHHLAVGQTVGAYAGGPAAKYRVSGIVSFGKTGTVAGTTFMVFDYPRRNACSTRQASSTSSGSARSRASPATSSSARSARCCPPTPGCRARRRRPPQTPRPRRTT
ncbi:MAG: putative transport system permease protein [Gaiellaceae bacterium]|nr:putative transport system permease protein [Gaiellaceae bacterium]